MLHTHTPAFLGGAFLAGPLDPDDMDRERWEDDGGPAAPDEE